MMCATKGEVECALYLTQTLKDTGKATRLS